MHITIGIPVLNKLELTKQCVDSIFKNTNYNTYSLLFIDNGSIDGTKEYLQALNAIIPIQIITNEINAGFPRACNQILSGFKGDAVVILNNDTIVPTGWLSGLAEQLTGNVGIVGCKMISKTGAMVHAGANIVNSKIQHMDYPSATTVDLINGACMLISRKLADSGLTFDESYGLGYFEEFTYEIEAKKLGFHTVYVPTVSITHLMNGTSSMIADISILFKKNWLDFCKRYGIDNEQPKALISFIVAAYNRPEHLKLLYQSLMLQTDSNWECIVMDEGDNESTIPNDPRFSYHKFDRIIIPSNGFNHRGSLGLAPKDAGLQYAKGEFIVFANEDNYFTPVFVELMKKEQDGSKADLVYCDFLIYSPGVGIHTPIHLDAYPVHGRITIGNYILRKSVIGDLRFAKFFDKDQIGIADGLFIEELVKKGIQHKKCGGVLMVQN